MPVTTFERVLGHIADVTAAQIGKCHKLIDLNAAPPMSFYRVENERDDVDSDGQIIEYSVRYEAELGFSCTCPSGAHGFANVHHPSGVCKHVRWAVAAALEERLHMREMAAKAAREQEAARQAQADSEAGTRPHYLAIDGKEATPREYARVMHAQYKPPAEADVQRDLKTFNRRPFSLDR